MATRQNASRHASLALKGASAEAFVLGLAVASLLSSPLAGQAPGKTIQHARGVVLNRVTGQPVPHALVFSGDRSIATLTDSEGRFGFDREASPPDPRCASMQGVDPSCSDGSVQLQAKKPGFLEGYQPASVFGPASSTSGLVLHLMPESIMEGRLTTGGPDIPSHAIVQLLTRQIQNGIATWQQGQITVTDSRGGFRFAGLAAGDYRLYSHEWSAYPTPAVPIPGKVDRECPPVFFPGGGPNATAHLAPGQTVQANLLLRSVPYFPIHIPIGNVPAGTGVQVVVDSGDPVYSFTLGYNPRTQSIEGSLPNGAYTVLASSFVRTAAGAANHGDGQPAGSNVTVAITVKGAPVTLPPVALVANGSIPVLVQTQFANPPDTGNGSGQFDASPGGVRGGSPQRTVELYLLPEKSGGPTATLRQSKNADDPLVIDNVAPGRYWAIIATRHGYVASASAGGVDLSTEPLIVGPGGSSAPVQITLRDDTATLKVTLATPIPATEGQWPALIACIPVHPLFDEGSFVSAGPDGTGTIPNLRPGKYRVFAFRGLQQPRIEFRNEEAMRRFDHGSAIVTVAAGENAEATAPLLTDEDLFDGLVPEL